MSEVWAQLQAEADRMAAALSGTVPCVCGAWGLQYPLPTERGEVWQVETFATEREALAAAARVMRSTVAEFVLVQVKRGGLWQEPHETITREGWEAYNAEQGD